MKRLGDSFYTQVTGVTMGPEGSLRQEALALLQERMRENPTEKIYVDLIPEPDNPYDANAIKVMADVPELGGRIQLGYVKNSQCFCKLCDYEHERYPRDNTCSRCGTVGQLVREGIATKLSEEQRADPNIRRYAEITEVTGGSGEKPTYGCNLRIAKVWRRSPSKVPTTGADLPEPPPARGAPAAPAKPSTQRVYDWEL